MRISTKYLCKAIMATDLFDDDNLTEKEIDILKEFNKRFPDNGDPYSESEIAIAEAYLRGFKDGRRSK